MHGEPEGCFPAKTATSATGTRIGAFSETTKGFSETGKWGSLPNFAA